MTTERGHRLRIAMFVGSFPVVSETFIANQIIGLIQDGHMVDIFSIDQPKRNRIHAFIEDNNLLEMCTYLRQNDASKIENAKSIASCLVGNRGWFGARGRSLLKKTFKRVPDWSYISVFRLAARTLESKPYDIVHCQFGDLGVRVLPLMERGLITGKLITSIRGHDITQTDRFDQKFYARLMDAADAFLPVSESLRQRLLKMGCPDKKISIVRSGIDCARFRFTLRNMHYGDAFRIISVARLVEMKGIEYAVRAVARIASFGIVCRYEVIGSGPMRSSLETLAAELGIEEQVIFLGSLNHDEVVDRLARSHVMIVPSVTAENGEQEGIPNALKEAMALGVLVVATKHSGIPELVEDGLSGYLVEEKSHVALADALQMLHAHPNTWAVLSSNARRTVECEYDLPIVHRHLIAAYQATLTH